MSYFTIIVAFALLWAGYAFSTAGWSGSATVRWRRIKEELLRHKIERLGNQNIQVPSPNDIVGPRLRRLRMAGIGVAHPNAALKVPDPDATDPETVPPIQPQTLETGTDNLPSCTVTLYNYISEPPLYGDAQLPAVHGNQNIAFSTSTTGWLELTPTTPVTSTLDFGTVNPT